MPEALNLPGRQRPVTARRQIEFQESNLYPPKLFDELSEMLKHHADLVLAPFGEANLVPRVVTGFNQLDVRGGSLAPVQRNAFGEGGDLLLGQVAVDLDDVGLDDVAYGRGDTMGELAVVGEEKQAFAGIV